MKNQRWLSWLLLIVMGYLVYTGSQSRGPEKPATAVSIPAITKENYPALAEATDVEAWKRKLNPDYAATMNCTLDTSKDGPAFKVIEDVAGEGEGAACGQTVVLQLTVWNANGGKAFEDEVTLALGSRQVAAGLDYGVLGMKPGAVRMLVMPPVALVRGKGGKEYEVARKALPAGKMAVVTVKRVK